MADNLIKEKYWGNFIKGITNNLDDKAKIFLMNNFDKAEKSCLLDYKTLYKNIESINQLVKYDVINRNSQNEKTKKQVNEVEYFLTTTGESVVSNIKLSEQNCERVL